MFSFSVFLNSFLCYPFQKLHRQIWRRIETTISQLSDQFNISRIRVRTLGGLTLGVLLNQYLGRSLMALKDVVYA